LKFVVTLEPDEAGWIVAECPALPGCLSQGRTEREALANIREAIAGNLAVRKELGLPLFIRVAEVEVESPSA
jgi:predicted RNase H-like HicB family nuclease